MDEQFTEDRYYEVIGRSPFTEKQIKKLSEISKGVFLAMLHEEKISEQLQDLASTNRMLKWVVGIGAVIIMGLMGWIKSDG